MILYMTINLLEDNFLVEVIVPYSDQQMLLIELTSTDFSETINSRCKVFDHESYYCWMCCT